MAVELVYWDETRTIRVHSLVCPVTTSREKVLHIGSILEVNRYWEHVVACTVCNPNMPGVVWREVVVVSTRPRPEPRPPAVRQAKRTKRAKVKSGRWPPRDIERIDQPCTTKSYGGEQEIGWRQWWMSQANCKSPDPVLQQWLWKLWWDDSTWADTVRRCLCWECPVRKECLQDALDNGPEYGMWGGADENERNEIAYRRTGRRPSFFESYGSKLRSRLARESAEREAAAYRRASQGKTTSETVYEVRATGGL